MRELVLVARVHDEKLSLRRHCLPAEQVELMNTWAPPSVGDASLSSDAPKNGALRGDPSHSEAETSSLRQPPAAQVAELSALLGLAHDDPRLCALGGSPRALERFLNHNQGARGGVVKAAAKGLRATLAFREQRRLDR